MPWTNWGGKMTKLSSPKRVKAIKEAFDFEMAKGLGQNFLIDESMIDRIVEGAGLAPGDQVLEIGPGMGVLTDAMAEVADRVVAVEIDDRLIPILADTLSHRDNVEVVHGDVLALDLAAVLEAHFTKPPKVVANLPYYITTPIIMRFLEEGLDVTDLIVMVQKEVADRIIASPGNKTYGALSVAVQYYAEAEKLFRVPRSVFMPQPGVDSMVIRLRIRQERAVDVISRKAFFRVVKAAFGQRRKTLLNALSAGLELEKSALDEVFTAVAIDSRRRAETLSMDDFAALTNGLIRQKMLKPLD